VRGQETTEIKRQANWEGKKQINQNRRKKIKERTVGARRVRELTDQEKRSGWKFTSKMGKIGGLSARKR